MQCFGYILWDVHSHVYKIGEPVLQSSIFSTSCVLANANVQNAIHSLMIETNRHGEVIFHQYLKSRIFFFDFDPVCRAAAHLGHRK